MIDSFVAWLGGEAKTVSFAIFGGVIGFLAKAIYDLWMARRKEKLERINQQLKFFYGPLYALNQAGEGAWLAFRSQVRPNIQFFSSDSEPNQQDLNAWRIWMNKVFRPIHEEMLTIITKNSDLLNEDDLPEPLQLFCSHVAAYKAVFDRWKNGDFSENTSVSKYPREELNQYLGASFRYLKSEQHRLMKTRKVSSLSTRVIKRSINNKN